MAVVIAIGVRETGERGILAIDIGSSEEGAFWTTFLRELVARGLDGVQLVISDAHEGLKEAIATVLTGATFFTQYGFADATCGPQGFSGSDGLAFGIQ